MILAYLLLLTGLTISSVAIYYSVVGLTAIFSAAAVPIMIMGVSLEVAKLVCATWIKQYWTQVPRLMKTYMVVAIVILMLITSMGIFGFLSKAHNDQNLVSGDVQSRIAIFDEKIKTARDNVDADRKQLRQMDDAVDQVMGRSNDEKGADKAVAIRRGQLKDRAAIAKDIETNQKIISRLNDEAAPIRAEVRKVDAEVGPIKYIAAFIYGVAPDASMLEKAVTWIIITIVVVFDPLAVIMLLAAQMTFGWIKKRPIELEHKDDANITEVNDWFALAKKRARFWDKHEGHSYEPDDDELTQDQYDQINHIANEYKTIPESNVTQDPEPDEELPVVKKRFVGFGFPMPSYFNKPKEEVIEKEPVVESVTTNPWAMDERPGDYVEPQVVEETPTRPVNPEAAPGRNRGVMAPLAVHADNALTLGKASNSGFGNEYPHNPEKGDVFVRIDYLPNRVFKFNGNKWIEVDKDQNDLYTYDELYIKHLIDQIADGKYDAESLTDIEREQIAEYLRKNA